MNMKKLYDVCGKFNIDDKEFRNFLIDCKLEYTVSWKGDWLIADNLVNTYVRMFFDMKDDEERSSSVVEDFEEINPLAVEERERVKDIIKKQKETDFPVFKLGGCRGRNISVYRDRCIIKTDVTLGAILSENATDGEKTIFYKDIIGIQYKPSGLLIGYLQLETGSNQMNNLKSNMFSENTFTFEKDTEIVEEIKDYITYQVSLFKKL